MEGKYYKKNSETIEKLKYDLRYYCNQNNLETQELDHPEKGWVFQLKKSSKITLGISSRAVTVIIQNINDDMVKISTGNIKWASKVTGGLVAIFSPLALIAFPVLVSTCVGLVKQNNMLKQIEQFIENRMTLIDN
ncbi:hypothetical protein [Marinicrinis sediminis]|uniref:DUF4342 domain-containing protein n=1 Tax=Marinicrinis sediminis TaxID=1652465 RepID=A0ABW5R5H1_9BACL